MNLVIKFRMYALRNVQILGYLLQLSALHACTYVSSNADLLKELIIYSCITLLHVNASPMCTLALRNLCYRIYITTYRSCILYNRQGYIIYITSSSAAL